MKAVSLTNMPYSSSAQLPTARAWIRLNPGGLSRVELKDKCTRYKRPRQNDDKGGSRAVDTLEPVQ